jgi:hypothetical protein
MKSRIEIFLISFFLMALAFSIPCVAEDIPPGTVIKAENYVCFVDNESGKTAAVEEGLKLSPGDMLKTFDRASVTLGFGSDLVRVDPNTTIEVVATGGGGNMVIFLISGTVFVKAEKRTDSSSFMVATPGSVVETGEAEFTVESVILDLPEGDPATDAFLDAVEKQKKTGMKAEAFYVMVITTVFDGSVTSAVIDPKDGLTYSPVVIKKGEQITDRFDHAILGF